MKNKFKNPDLYSKTFIKASDKENNNIESDNSIKIKKEKKFIMTFLIQSLICLSIISSVLVIKYLSPKNFVSVSSALSGLYEKNITLEDLSYMLDDFISGNEALTTFFNLNP